MFPALKYCAARLERDMFRVLVHFKTYNSREKTFEKQLRVRKINLNKCCLKIRRHKYRFPIPQNKISLLMHNYTTDNRPIWEYIYIYIYYDIM